MKRKNPTPKSWLACVALLVAACTSSEDVSPEVDAALDAGVDAAVDAQPPTPPPSCTPATCEDEDEPSPWGCPSACEPSCGGDTVCCDDGTCLSRAFDDCSEGCDVEPTVTLTHFTLLGRTATVVCNRGTQEADATGWRLVLSADEEVLCETELEETIPSCECVNVYCDIEQSAWAGAEGGVIPMRAELELDDPLECGNPLGRVSENLVGYGHVG